MTMRYWMMLMEQNIPDVLELLAKAIRGRSYETAKRIIVAKVGSVQPGERFADDVADAVFLRLQRNAQVGQNTSEIELQQLGRGAQRLSGTDPVTIYRAAPKGAGIRPGDFVADSTTEAGFYRHGGNVILKRVVARHDLIHLNGTMGGGQEYVYLPQDHVISTPVEHFGSFRAFYDAVIVAR
jgi:hypothetical protein